MRFNSTALIPSSVTPQIGQVVSAATGPSGILQAINNIVTAVSLPASLVAGESYLVSARCEGTIITTNPNYVWARIQDTANLLIGYPVYVFSFSSAAYAVGNVVCGGINSIITAAASITDTFTLSVSASGSGGLQMAANSCELSLIRVQ